MDHERFSRQELLFGREGQAKIAAARVAIVGLGGTGSHVAQQLAYLGVRSFALIDADLVSKSNLNRLIGATEDDSNRASPKVDVAARAIQSVDPSIDLWLVRDTFVSEEGAAALASAQLIFGCVDRDGARLLLTEFACAYDRPYFDLATDIHLRTQPTEFGGRLMIRTGADGCLYCMGELDQDGIRRDLTSPERRAEEDRIYGVNRDALDEKGPSVVSLNGIVASLAVTEFMVLMTGVARAPMRLLWYSGFMGTVIRSTDKPREGCPYCTQTGRVKEVDWLRYVRAGVGRWVR